MAFTTSNIWDSSYDHLRAMYEAKAKEVEEKERQERQAKEEAYQLARKARIDEMTEAVVAALRIAKAEGLL